MNNDKTKQPRWRRQDGIIYFSEPIIVDERAGWMAKKILDEHPSDSANAVISSPDFQPTRAGTIIKPAIICKDWYKEDLYKNRLAEDYSVRSVTTKYVRNEATRLGFMEPCPYFDLALLIMKDFSVEEIREMGLEYLICMHDAIEISTCCKALLSIHVRPWFPELCGYDQKPIEWVRGTGFVYATV